MSFFQTSTSLANPVTLVCRHPTRSYSMRSYSYPMQPPGYMSEVSKKSFFFSTFINALFPISQQGEFAPPVPPKRENPTYLTAQSLYNLGPGSSPVDCPVCGQRRLTIIDYTVGTKTQCVNPVFPSTLSQNPAHRIPSIACGRSYCVSQSV
jgi:hypothetical protein